MYVVHVPRVREILQHINNDRRVWTLEYVLSSCFGYMTEIITV